MTNQTFIDASTGSIDTFFSFTDRGYWEQELSGGSGANPFLFFAGSGFSTTAAYNSFNVPWAVHDGDVASIPLPASLTLFASSLIGLIGVLRRRII